VALESRAEYRQDMDGAYRTLIQGCCSKKDVDAVMKPIVEELDKRVGLMEVGVATVQSRMRTIGKHLTNLVRQYLHDQPSD